MNVTNVYDSLFNQDKKEYSVILIIYSNGIMHRIASFKQLKQYLKSIPKTQRETLIKKINQPLQQIILKALDEYKPQK